MTFRPSGAVGWGVTPALPPAEDGAAPWEVVPLSELLRRLAIDPGARPERPRIVAVDGRSASGKTRLAAAMSDACPGATVVHTDDVAWHHSFFGWTELLLDNILEPARAGRPVAYRPTAWNERGRPGAIEVPRGCTLLLLEGVGAARRELMHAVDAVVWVESDFEQARARGIVRDGDSAEAAAFWDEWMAAELPFLADQRPWQRADVIVSGTPELEHDPATQVVVRQMTTGATRPGRPHGGAAPHRSEREKR